MEKNIWLDMMGLTPAPVDKPWFSDAYEVGRQAVAGAAVDLPRMAGQAARWVAPDNTDLDAWGRETVEAADARAAGWEPDMEGRGGLASTLIKGARAVAPMVPAIGAAFLPGGQWVAPAVAAGQFGTSSAQDTEDKLRQQGVTDTDATAAGWRTGLIQGPLEGLATAAGGWAFRGAKPLLGIGAQTTGSVASRMTDTAFLKPLTKGLGLNLLVQPATEVAQDVGTEFNERSYGASPEDAWEIAKDSAQGAVGLTLLLGPFAAGGQVRRVQRAEQIKQALYNPDTPEATRAQARDMVVQAAASEGVAPQNADAWLDEQFSADDARTAADQAREDAYIQNKAQKLFDDQGAAAKRQDLQDREEIQGLMTTRATTPAPLGDIAPGAADNTQGSAAVMQTVETVETLQAAQVQRETEATLAALPPTPEQIAEEQAAQQQVQLAQETVAFMQQNQIADKKAAPVIKEMLASPDVVTPELRGAIRGALTTGDVNGARKMLIDAKKAKQKAEADAIKAGEKARAEALRAQEQARKKEEKIVADGQKAEKANDDFAASVAATRTQPTQGTPADVPQPAQPGTQTSQAESPQGAQAVAVNSSANSIANIDPNKTITVGRKGREKQVTAIELSDKIKGASIIEQRRIARAMGWDVTQNPTTGAPMLVELNSPLSFAEIGRQEEAETGKVVSRQAIQQSLQKFGIDPQMVDQATSSDWGNSTVTDEELGIGRIDESGGDSSGLRIEKSAAKAMGQGLVNDGNYLTAEQRKAYDDATRLLNEAGMGSDVALSEDPRSKEQMDGTVVTDLRNMNPAQIEQNIRSLLNDTDAPNAQADWDDGRIMWDDLPDTLKADWINLYKINIAEHEDNYGQFAERLYRDQRSVEEDFVKLAARKPSDASGPKAITGDTGSSAGAQGAARIQEQVPGEVARDGGQADDNQDVVVGDGTKSTATAVAKKKRWVSQPVDDVEVKDARFSRAMQPLGSLRDKVGKQVQVMTQSLADMERTPAIKKVFDKYRADGIGRILGAVDNWFVTSNRTDWGGAYTEINGKPSIVMTMRTMLFPDQAEWTMHHEMGHAVDLVTPGGAYSGLPEFNLRIVGDKVRGHGVIADQVIEHYESNPDSPFAGTMRYPLDRKTHGDLDAQAIREEMFAQLWATYNTRVGKEYLEDNLPDVADFMEMVYGDIAQNDYGTEGVTGQADGGAPQIRPDRSQTTRSAGAQPGPRGNDQPVRGQAGVTDTPAFKSWFGDSKVVDAGGKPLVVYHGTTKDFNQFDTENGLMGPAAWFSPNPRHASGYAKDGSVLPVYLTIKNPYIAKNATEGSIISPERKAELIALGHDGIYEKRGAIEQWVAFDATQIKSATGNRGTFDGKNPDIRFSRGQSLDAKLTPATRAASGATQQFLKDVKSKAVLWGAFTEDLINSISGKLPAAKKYLELVKRGQVEKTHAEREIESILDRFNTLSKVERGTGPSSVNVFLKDSTTKKLWGYQPSFLPDAKVDGDMSVRFNQLSPEAQGLVRAVFQHGNDNLQKLKSAVMGNINTEFDALIAGYEAEGDAAAADKERKAKQKALRDYQSLTALSGDWPYAPLKRFGNHVVVGKSQAYLDAEEGGDTKELEKLRANENHYFVSFAETKREARNMRDQIADKYADATNFEKDGVEYGSRDMMGAFRRLRTLVEDSQNDKLASESKRAMNRVMMDLHLTLLGEQSARQAERTRTGVAGADEDMMRAFATQGRASAHFIASLTNNGQVAEELRNMRKQADTYRGTEREGARDAYNEVLRRHAMGIDYQPTPFVDKALGANSTWMLLTSPAYFLTNATQPFVVSLPVLAGRNGYTRSFSAMTKAYNDIAPLIKDGTITQDDYSRMPADVRNIIEELANRGRIDISLEQDLGRWRSEEDSKLAVFGKVVDKMRGFTQTVESVNRVATAIAAARLAKQNGMSDAEATQYADEVIFTTHGDYSAFNAPRVMRTGLGRLMTQFRKFQLIQISMYAKLINSSFKGASPEERMIGRRALAYSLGHMFLLGGTLGMPGAQAIGWVLRQAFGDDDEPDNPEVTLRKMLPPELGDLLVKGAPAALGMDLSGRLGAGNMLSLLPYADTDLNRTGYQSAAMAALGPFFGGLLPKFADGLGMINQGDYWKGMEQLVPKGLSDVSKAMRQVTEGITQRNGDIAMSADEVSFLASFGQAVGLPTTSLTERSMLASAKFKADEFFNKRTAQVKKEYVEAYRAGDNEGLMAAREEWARMQEARKEYGYKVQPISELVKAPQAQVKREANRAGGVPYKKDNEQFVRSMTQM